MKRPEKLDAATLRWVAKEMHSRSARLHQTAKRYARQGFLSAAAEQGIRGDEAGLWAGHFEAQAVEAEGGK